MSGSLHLVDGYIVLKTIHLTVIYTIGIYHGFVYGVTVRVRLAVWVMPVVAAVAATGMV
jgi:hypothetical protein